MTRRAQSVALGAFVFISFASLMVTAYLYGKSSGKIQPERVVAGQTKILIGRLVRIEPLHVYLENAELGHTRTYDVLISPQTMILQLKPWAPGEREKAVDDYSAYIDKLKPKAGDPVMPPPSQMKPGPLDLTTLATGTELGVLSIDDIDPDKPVVAAAIRPLMPQEAERGNVENSFPL